ncbi:hypothetical protein VTN00DRAFT_5237 [Thermoascus crustaceus]|uniref:uncharacterized protein n=1 Tax=Thermoascus crustaceus TaxID=5088 RepID=UPI00374341F2
MTCSLPGWSFVKEPVVNFFPVENLNEVKPIEIAVHEIINRIYVLFLHGRMFDMNGSLGREYLSISFCLLEPAGRDENETLRLREHGVCDRGLVPRLYGTIGKINPKLYKPYLNTLRQDENLPNAILLEYIHGMVRPSMEDYTPERMNGFMEIMRGIHKAHVLIDDTLPIGGI